MKERLFGCEPMPELTQMSSTTRHTTYGSPLLKEFTKMCQILRSSGEWSMGLHEKSENSIQLAYVELILKAEHFINIENQFFVSSTAGDKVNNQIAQALVDRIIEAFETKKMFFGTAPYFSIPKN